MCIISPKESFSDNYKACFCNNVVIIYVFHIFVFNQSKIPGYVRIGGTINTDFYIKGNSPI